MMKIFIDIKNRLILLSIAIFSVISILYYYKDLFLFLFIVLNVNISNNVLHYFIFTSITEMFDVYFIIICSLTSYIVYIYLSYLFVCFLSLGFYRKEYIYFKYMYLLSLFLKCLGVYFFFNFLLPLVFNFFLSFKNLYTLTINFHYEAKLIDFINFYKDLYFICFLIYQCFIFLVLLSNYINNNFLILQTYRKLVYLLLLLFSTIITPPDIFSQIFVFSVFTIFFEIQIFCNILITLAR